MTDAPPIHHRLPAVRVWVALATTALIMIVLALWLPTGAIAERIRHPQADGAVRPVDALFGINWVPIYELGTAAALMALVVVSVVTWDRSPGHPRVMMVIACSTLAWQDPLQNWAAYVVYNPQLHHWPESWAWASISPTVQPVLCVGYALFFMAPAVPATFALRRLQAARPLESVVHRRPLRSLAVLTFLIGWPFDTLLEMFLVRTQLYTFSHVNPFGAFGAGQWYQFPVLIQGLLLSPLMITIAVLMYRDDSGVSQATRLARRVRSLRNRPKIGPILVMAVAVNLAFGLSYGGGFGLTRVLGLATSVGCPYPFAEAKVYDPHARYEEAGQAGPYFPGIWAGWQSGQADGRPNASPSADSRCD